MGGSESLLMGGGESFLMAGSESLLLLLNGGSVLVSLSLPFHFWHILRCVFGLISLGDAGVQTGPAASESGPENYI